MVDRQSQEGIPLWLSFPSSRGCGILACRILEDFRISKHSYLQALAVKDMYNVKLETVEKGPI